MSKRAMIRGHYVEEITQFNGRWNRGQDIVAPSDHALSEQNCEFEYNAVKSRAGFDLYADLGAGASKNISRVHLYEKSSADIRLLWLSSTSGKIFDSTVSNTVAILTIASMTDFALYSINGRAYITPFTAGGNSGLASDFVYVYDGTTCRKAAGAEPTAAGGFAAAASAAAGHIDKGNYLISVAYETSTGFITPFSNNVILYAAPASKKIDISGIPTGPSGTVARRIIISKVFHKAYSNNYKDYEMFFAIGGRIADNTSTTVTLNFYSNDLSDSADYLIDQLTEIPASLGISSYNGSMVTWAESGNTGIIRISATGSPESFAATDGFMLPAPWADVGGIRHCREYRGQLNIHKSNSSFTTVSNGDAPATWQVVSLDGGLGCVSSFGCSNTFNESGASFENFYLIASKSGVHVFGGSFDPMPLTFKIDDDYKSYGIGTNAATQILVDQGKKAIYLLNYSDKTVFYGDYSQGLDWKNIKWSYWKTAALTSSSITGIFLYFSDSTSGVGLGIHSTTDTKALLQGTTYNAGDYGAIASTPIQSFYETAFLPAEESFLRYHCDGTLAFGNGAGLCFMTLTLTNNLGAATTLTNYTLSSAGTAIEQFQNRCNVTASKFKFKLNLSSGGTFFIITKLAILIKPTITVLPA